MFKMLAMAGVAALVTACAGPLPGVAGDPMEQSRGSTPSGEVTAAGLGFHGPLDRVKRPDGPN